MTALAIVVEPTEDGFWCIRVGKVVLYHHEDRDDAEREAAQLRRDPDGAAHAAYEKMRRDERAGGAS